MSHADVARRRFDRRYLRKQARRTARLAAVLSIQRVFGLHLRCRRTRAASWSSFPHVYNSEPFFRAKKEGWELFRIGPTNSYATSPGQRVSYPDTQFPNATFDQLTKQAVPRWATNDAATQQAYDQYVQKACPCVIVVHSQGSNFAFNAALHAPDKIKAIVALKPSGSLDPSKVAVEGLEHIPLLFVWGDHIKESGLWRKSKAASLTFQSALKQHGTTADMFSLPELGMLGNTHMLMMDKNSDEIATRVQQWHAQQGIMR